MSKPQHRPAPPRRKAASEPKAAAKVEPSALVNLPAPVLDTPVYNALITEYRRGT